MTGLDTNVLARYFVKDDAQQGERASALLLNECTPESPGFVNYIVLCELVWVLGQCYDIPKERIVGVLAEILQAPQIRVQSPRTVWLALEDYSQGAADFADCLVARVNLDYHCEATLTFDRDAADSPGFRLLR